MWCSSAGAFEEVQLGAGVVADRFDPVGVLADLLELFGGEEDLLVAEEVSGRDLAFLAPAPERLTRYTGGLQDLGDREVVTAIDAEGGAGGHAGVVGTGGKREPGRRIVTHWCVM